MMALNQIIGKGTAGYKLSKLQENLKYMDDIKLSAKNEKELETLIQTIRIYSQDIGMEFSIEKCAMLVMKSGKRHMTEGVEQPNQVIRTLGEKETSKFLSILEVDTIKQVQMKERFFLNISEEPENYSKQNSIVGTLSKG